MSFDDINRETLGSLSLSQLQELATERGLETDCRTHSRQYPEDILTSRILYDARMRRKAVINSPKLAGLQNIIAALDAAKSPYFCVGNLGLEASSPVKIVVASENSPTTYTSIQFPLTHEAAIQPLIDASQQASFGRGGEDVLDPSYRRALVLHPDRIVITPAGSLEPHAMGIVEAINQSLVSISDGSVSPRRVVAVFDKLNVYSEGDFFKGHVDTPSSPGMFGTLLINLPVAHEGGQLVVRAPEASGKYRKGAVVIHDDGEGSRKQYMTNWAGSTDINWIAFFSDCEHEVLPVTRGNRVTLSYTLSFADPIKEAKQNHPVDVEAIAGSKDLTRQRLIRALKAPGVLTKDRSRLCFYLQHKYPVDWEDPDLWSIKSHLKGRDAVLYHALQAMDAEITLHLAFFTDYQIENDIKHYDPGEGLIAILPPEADVSDVVRQSHGPSGSLPQMMGKAKAQVPEEMGLVEVPGDPELFVRLAYLTYDDGPDCTEEVTYGSMCLIATLPPQSASTENEDSLLPRQSPSARKRKLSENEEEGRQRPPAKI